MFAVGTCYQPSLLLLTLIILPTVTEAQGVRVEEVVAGYLDQDVTLPCWFRTESPSDVVTSTQWTRKPNGAEKESIILFNPQFEPRVVLPDSPLKGRVVFANTSKDDFSLIIKAVVMTDKGEFTCTLTTFPEGSLEGITSLTVQGEAVQEAFLPAGTVTGIVVAVILLLIVMAAIAYFIIRKRQGQHVSTGRPTVEVARTSKVLREEDLVYMDTKTYFASCRINADSVDDEYKPETPQNYDVTYSHVRVGRQHPGREEVMHAKGMII